MSEINRRDSSPLPGVNSSAANYSRLLDLDVLSTWTLDRQREHTADIHAYEAVLAAFQSALRSEVVDGDGRLSAPMRARKVEKHLKALVKASKRAEKAAETLRTSYAAHRAQVKALPAQRQAKAVKKAGRRDVLAEVTAKSLHKTASAFTQAPAEVTAPAAAEPTGSGARGITDLWRKGA